ncbi:MAG: helix-turn-helix domain-containing protein [Candidatus Parcubacteria bacterium]|nr:helix-turn-helix domain-containing protein [Candidatus Parcubacteria bacterium]
MIKKEKEKEYAIKLRKEGKTYSEILGIVQVARSTLSIWLKEAKLSKPEEQKFTEAKRLASLRGGQAKKKQRIEKQNRIFLEARSKIKTLSEYEFFLIGVVLYWAEGTKEKEYRPGSQVAFSNMDPKMIILFLKWLDKICKIPKYMIGFEIMIHVSHRERIEEVRQFWSKMTGFDVNNFSKVYFKNSKIKKTNRKNTGEKYHGVLKIKVKRSSDLVRKIASWSETIFEEVLKIKSK